MQKMTQEERDRLVAWRRAAEWVVARKVWGSPQRKEEALGLVLDRMLDRKLYRLDPATLKAKPTTYLWPLVAQVFDDLKAEVETTAYPTARSAGDVKAAMNANRVVVQAPGYDPEDDQRGGDKVGGWGDSPALSGLAELGLTDAEVDAIIADPEKLESLRQALEGSEPVGIVRPPEPVPYLDGGEREKETRTSRSEEARKARLFENAQPLRTFVDSTVWTEYEVETLRSEDGEEFPTTVTIRTPSAHDPRFWEFDEETGEPILWVDANADSTESLRAIDEDEDLAGLRGLNSWATCVGVSGTEEGRRLHSRRGEPLCDECWASVSIPCDDCGRTFRRTGRSRRCGECRAA